MRRSGSVRTGAPASRPVCGVTAPSSAPTCQTRLSVGWSAGRGRGRVSGPPSVSRPQPGVTESNTARMAQTRLAVGFLNWDCRSLLSGVAISRHVRGQKSTQTSDTLSVLYFVYLERRDTIKTDITISPNCAVFTTSRAVKSTNGELNWPQVYILLDILARV